MVIRREDNGVSSLKIKRRGSGPREDLWLCLLESMWTDSVIFQRGSMRGSWGWPTESPRGVQGLCRGSR